MRIAQKGSLLIAFQILFLLNLPAVTASAGWQSFPSPTGEDLNSVFMVDANDGWAVGAFGTIIHWNGASWSIVASPTGDALNSVFMVNSNDAWAVGLSGDIIQWDGTSWKFVTNIDFLNSVFMVNSQNGWAVGSSGTALYYAPLIPQRPVGDEIPATNRLATVSAWLIMIASLGIVAVMTLIAKKLRLA